MANGPAPRRVGSRRMAVFKGCVICKGSKKRPRNGKGGQTCSAATCKDAYKLQRAEQPTAGLVADAPPADLMPDGKKPFPD